MMMVLLIQAGLFLGSIVLGGTLRQLDNNAFDILNERVINRKNDLQNKMVQQWSNLESSAQQINATVRAALAEYGAEESALVPGADVTSGVLAAISDDIIDMLRRRGTTGAFIVFEGADHPGRTDARAGLLFRDYDPSTSPPDNSDLLAARAPAGVANQLGIPLDTYWQPQFTFNEADPAAMDYYYKPFDAARRFPGISYKDLGYWARPYSLGEQESSVISYSVPLFTAEGEPYGVLGVTISMDYLRRQLPYDELATNKDAAYVLAIESSQPGMEVLFASGPSYQTLFGNAQHLTRSEEPVHADCYSLTAGEPGENTVYGCLNPLRLYNTNTPFEEDQWMLIGIMDEHHLLVFSKGVAHDIFWAIAISLIMGIGCIFIASRLSAQPIMSLMAQVRKSNASLPVRFAKTNIYEIDEMASAIESLSRNVAESSSKLSQIIELSSIKLGAFEYDPATAHVFFTNRFFSILGCDEIPGGYMDQKAFTARMEHVRPLLVRDDSLDEDGVYICKVPHEETGARWARLRIVASEARTIGVVEDITQEMVEKQKIEYERDYDLLTNLLNRRAFHAAMASLFQTPERLKVAALIMLDLDNLKYINDTYGHDCGDQYICCMAQILKETAPYHSIISRMSGDEFYVFLYGYHAKEEVRALIGNIRAGITSSMFTLPNAPNFRVRASAGVAWYPNDSTVLDELIRYADFAMYTVKNSVKGEFSEFSIESYKKDAYLLQGSEALNRLIDDELVDYHFQPIVDARTGATFAYEALMRPRMDTLKSPGEVLALARSQFKLYQIERLTSTLSLRQFATHQNVPEDCRIFVNSIANQLLGPQDVEYLEANYMPLLRRLVIELTEEEKMNSEFTVQKKKYLQRWGAQLALDDYGTGYNGDASLLYLEPNYVKVDLSIVRDIDKDENRLKMFQNLVSYARDRHIAVIAEGVETLEEMTTLIENGVDYLQGYYLGRPSLIPQTPSEQVVEEITRAAYGAAL